MEAEKEAVEEAEARIEEEPDPDAPTGLIFGGVKWVQ
jgi:hypothetical protein